MRILPSHVGLTCVIAMSAMSCQVGIRPVACDPDQVPFPPPAMQGMLKESPAEGQAVLSDRAVMGKLEMPGFTLSPKVAIDYSQPAAEQPDVLHIDFTGEGQFDKETAVPLHVSAEQSSGRRQAVFGPAEFETQHDNQMFLVSVRGLHVQLGNQNHVVLTAVTAIEGECSFAGGWHAVRFVDGTGDLRFDQAGKFDSKKRRSMGPTSGDIVIIDLEDDDFDGAVLKAYYGQPVFVDGAWYEVTLADDRSQITATPVQVEHGMVGSGAERWAAVLECDGEAFYVAGGDELAALPVGQYKLVYFQQWSAPDTEGRQACLLAGLNESMSGRGKTITIEPGQTTRLDLGAPLTARFSARVSNNRAVEFRMDKPMTAGGLSVTLVSRDGSLWRQRPDPPKVVILNEQLQEVDVVTLEYG